MKTYSLQEGERIVKAARAAIELHLGTHNFDSSIVRRELGPFTEKAGEFVNIEHYPTGTPRGRHGSPNPSEPLHTTIVDSAIAAATSGREHVPVSHLEFDHILIEVTIISELEQLPKSLASARRQIRPGVNGLYLEYGYHNAVLLPQEWHGSTIDKQLAALFARAGLPEHHLKLGTAKLYKFTAQVFRELTPRGPVEEMRFG